MDEIGIGVVHRVVARGYVAPDHHAHQRIARHALGRRGRDELAVAQHGDPVGDIERFFQRVRDEDDAGAALLESVEQMEEMLHFFRRQRCGRLVENEDLGIVPHGPDNLDHLPFGGAEVFNQREGIDIEVQRL